MKLLFIGTAQDKPFVPRLKDVMGAHTVAVYTGELSYITELKNLCKRAETNKVITSSPALLAALLNKRGDRKAPTLDNYAGSFFTVPDTDIEVVILPPCEWLVKVNYGKFLYRRYISKHTTPEAWPTPPDFHYEELSASNYLTAKEDLETCDICGVDIETALIEGEPIITMISYTPVWLATNVSKSYVMLFRGADDPMFNLSIMRQLNSSRCAKILQNGKYDISYLARWNAPLHNYIWDTATMFHCWYSELPKDLATLQAFFVRKSMYWKDMAQSPDLRDQLLYNAKDTWSTVAVLMAMVSEMPKWARTNYLQEFPLIPPCHMAEMRGIKVDMERLAEAATDLEQQMEAEVKYLQIMCGVPINPSSPLQVKKLLHILGCKDLESSDEKTLKKAAYRHPLNNRILDTILGIRKKRKTLTTYLQPDKMFRGRLLFSLNPHGTDSGRLASKEHHFWTGFNIQNQTRGVTVKQIYIADPDFEFWECDLEQAESRDTAHIAGCEALIKAVSGGQDFHSLNASAFFGVHYSKIYDDDLEKTLDKALRDLAKRVNHGANYNMGEAVLVDTMGLQKIYEAQKLLNLSPSFNPKQIAGYLLGTFHNTYPEIKKIYYPGVVVEILATSRLTSKAVHTCEYQATTAGWVRYCFGQPDKNKLDLNAYVAHPPQSLNAMTLNKAYIAVFYDVALPSPTNFKLGPQIHDSIFFATRKGYKHLALKVKDLMEIPVKVKGYDGKTREFTVPAALKGPAERWSDVE